MRIIYKIKAVIALLMSLYFLFSDEWKTFAGFFIYTLLMYTIYIDEYLTEIKDEIRTNNKTSEN